jgi:hypothetical protein
MLGGQVLSNGCGSCSVLKRVYHTQQAAIFKNCLLSPTSFIHNTMYYKLKHNPYKMVALFEEEIANYTGAAHAVAVDSCTRPYFYAANS